MLFFTFWSTAPGKYQIETRLSNDVNFTVVIITCANPQPQSNRLVILGPEEIAELDNGANLPTFEEFIADFHNLGLVCKLMMSFSAGQETN